METLFVVLSPSTYQGGQAKKSGYFEGSSEFHRYKWISTLIKYISSLDVKNQKCSTVYWEFRAKIMEIKVAEINAPITRWRGNQRLQK